MARLNVLFEFSNRFEVSGLESGSELNLVIFSTNSRGRSEESVFLRIDLPSLPVKQLETRHDTGKWKVTFLLTHYCPNPKVALTVYRLIDAALIGIFFMIPVFLKRNFDNTVIIVAVSQNWFKIIIILLSYPVIL